MKLSHILCICLWMFWMSIPTIMAQSPQGFSYQAVIRNGGGTILQSTPVKLRLGIRSGIPTGMIVYREVHNTQTDVLGLVNVTVGQGTVDAGIFSDIPWSSGNKYMEVEVDVNNSGSYITLSTTQIMSVPYALYAEKTGLTAGAGLQITNNVIQNTGDANGSDDINIGTTAGGDLSGSYPNPTVYKIQGQQVSNVTPIAGQVLKHNGSGWVPSADNNTVYDAGPGISISSNIIANTGDTDASNDMTTGMTAGGDLNAAYPNPVVARIQGHPISNLTPSTGYVLKWNGTEWAPAPDLADSSAAGGIWLPNNNDIYNVNVGNVGIGINNPQSRLHVESPASAVATLRATNANGISGVLLKNFALAYEAGLQLYGNAGGLYKNNNSTGMGLMYNLSGSYVVDIADSTLFYNDNFQSLKISKKGHALFAREKRPAIARIDVEERENFPAGYFRIENPSNTNVALTAYTNGGGTGMTGINNSGLNGIGVHGWVQLGLDNSIGVKADNFGSGFGVQAFSQQGVAIKASIADANTGKTALHIDNGYIKVTGNTARTAYVHTTNASNTTDHRTFLNYPNMDASDLLFVQHNFVSAHLPRLPVGVTWNAGQNRWEIYLERQANPEQMPLGEKFNVLIIKQ